VSKVIIELSDWDNIYDLDAVSCFDRPIAIILEKIDKDLASFFVMFRKLFQIFNYDDMVMSELDFWKQELENGENLEDYIFRKLGLKYVEQNVCDSFKDAVRLLLDAQTPVLAPGNLFEMYYSVRYKTKNWPHMFLVNGYDSDNDLFYILDYIQSMDMKEYQADVAYVRFAIRCDDLESAYQSFSCFDKNPTVRYLIKQSAPINKQALLLEFLELLRNKAANTHPIEKRLTEEIIARSSGDVGCDSEEANEWLYKLSRSCKRKEAMISEMLRQVNNHSIPDEAMREMETLKENITNSWALLTNKFYMSFLKGRPKLNDADLSNVIQMEDKLYGLAYALVSEAADPVTYDWGSL